MKRNKITGRVSDNVRPARAKMSKEQVEEYFHNLQLELDGVASENIFNFDGTNFTDDPKRKTVLNKWSNDLYRF